jgi:hypothetical protein
LHISVALALDYEEVLKRPGLLPEVPVSEIDGFLDDLFGLATFEKSVPKLWPRMQASLSDPDDKGVVELAVTSNAIVVAYNVRHFAGQNVLE